jgi:hypothetical protein
MRVVLVPSVVLFSFAKAIGLYFCFEGIILNENIPALLRRSEDKL